MNKFLLAAMALALTSSPLCAQLQMETIAPVAKKSTLFPTKDVKLSTQRLISERQTRADEDTGVPFSAKTLSNMSGADRNVYVIKESIGGIYEQAFRTPLKLGSVLRIATLYDPALLARFDGNKITKINVTIPTNCKNVKPFILNLEGEKIWEGKMTTKFNSFSKVKPATLECDYTISKETPILVGFEVVAKSNEVILPVVQNAVTNGLLLGDSNGLIDLSGSGLAAHVDCVTEGAGGLRNNDVNVLEIEGGRIENNKEYQTVGTFINYGAAPVNKVKFTYTIDGKDISEELKANKPIPYMVPVQLGIESVSPEKGGRYKQEFTIQQINGVDDEFTETNVFTKRQDNSAFNVLTSITNPYGRTAVMEQMTGTWCGWCPRGHVAMEKASQAYPNDFIGIAVHAGDKLECAEYTPLVNITGGNFPSAFLNRIGFSAVDPYYGFGGQSEDPTKSGDVLNDIKMINSMPSEAKVGISSKLDATGKNIELESNLSFSIDVAGKLYSVGYVLLENGITKVDQKNFYSKEAGAFKSESDIAEEDLRFLFNQRSVYFPTFNHVARSIKDIEGVQGSLDGIDFTAGKVFTHKYSLPIPEVVKDNKNLEVAVLLFDKLTGEILTGAKAKVGEVSTGVESVVEDVAEIEVVEGAINVKGNGNVAVYSVDGKLVSKSEVNGSVSVPTSGLKGTYVVRVVSSNNVTVKKVML